MCIRDRRYRYTRPNIFQPSSCIALVYQSICSRTIADRLQYNWIAEKNLAEYNLCTISYYWKTISTVVSLVPNSPSPSSDKIVYYSSVKNVYFSIENTLNEKKCNRPGLPNSWNSAWPGISKTWNFVYNGRRRRTLAPSYWNNFETSIYLHALRIPPILIPLCRKSLLPSWTLARRRSGSGWSARSPVSPGSTGSATSTTNPTPVLALAPTQNSVSQTR